MINNETYPELEEVIKTLRDVLEDWEIPHELTQSEEEPFVYLCTTFDGRRRNGGMIIWNREKKKVMFLALNEEAVIRNEMEGIEDGSGECILINDLDTFLLFMDGTAKMIVDAWRDKSVKEEFGDN